MDDLKITPIGGVQEVGANCFLYEVRDYSFIVDCGVHPGYDFDPHEIWERFVFLKGKNVQAIILTHCHLDHAGAAIIVANMLKVPIYTSTIGALLITAWHKTASFEDFELSVIPEIKIFKNKDVIQIKDVRITAYELAHSIPESFGFRIQVGIKIILHFGDFKLTGYDKDSYHYNLEQLEEMSHGVIDVAVIDIVNIKRAGVTPPEKSVVDNLFDLVVSNPNQKHFIFAFATNIRRLANLWVQLHKAGVNVTFRGRAMHTTAHILSEAVGIDLKHVYNIPLAKTNVFFCTGSQGEPGSYMQRLAENKTRLEIAEGDCIYLSSMLIPQERYIFSQNKKRLRKYLQDLHSRGARIFLNRGQANALDTREFVTEADIHVSGHECRDGIETILKTIKASRILPYHAPMVNVGILKQLLTKIANRFKIYSHIVDIRNNETVTI